MGFTGDVDLIAVGGNYRGLFGYVDLVESLEKALGKRIDLVTRMALDESGRESDHRFADNIKNDGVLLYEK